MAAYALFLLALIAGSSLVSCQLDRDFERERAERERERERERQRVSIPPACVRKVMDVFFVLDSSSSIYINDYMSQHRVVRDIINRFDVSPDATRVGMLTFSDVVERPVIGLNRYSTKDELTTGITMQNLPYRTGVTNTDMAIRHVRQLNDFRQDITKVMVILTDGGSRSPGSTAREAELARAAGFYVFVVGIGQYIEEREWRSMASDPDESFIYNITNARFMEDVRFSLPPRACALPPIFLPGSCDVSRMSDVHFVASRSASNEAIELIDNIKRGTTDRDDQLRINYMIEACGSVLNAALDDEDVTCDRFFTRTGDTAESVKALFSTARDRARQSKEDGGDVNQVIVLFADDPTLSLARFDWANDARFAQSFEDITVIVVNLGMRTYQNFAQTMAGNRNNYFVFPGGSVANHYNQQRQLLDAICNGVNDYQEGPDFDGRPN